MNRAKVNPLNYAGPATNSSGMEILSDGSNGTFHCRIIPHFTPGFLPRGLLAALFIIATLSPLLFLLICLPFSRLRFLVSDLIPLSVAGVIFLIIQSENVRSAFTRKVPDSFEFIADGNQFTVKLNGVSLETFPKNDIRDIALRRIDLPVSANVQWALCFLWSNNKIAHFRFHAPGDADLGRCQLLIRQTLNLSEDSNASRFVRANELLAVQSGKLVRRRFWWR